MQGVVQFIKIHLAGCVEGGGFAGEISFVICLLNERKQFDKNIQNAENISKILIEAGFDVETVECDISSRDSIKNIIEVAQSHGEIAYFINAAGVSPSPTLAIDSKFKENKSIISLV